MSKKPTIELLTPVFRMSYPALIAAKEFKDRGKPTGKFSFQVEAIFEETDLPKFKMFDETGKLQEVDLAKTLHQLTLTAWPDLSPLLDPSQPESPTNPRLDPVVALFKRQLGKGWPIKKGDAIKQKLEATGKKGDQYVGKRVLSLKSNKTENTRPPILSYVTGKETWKALDRNSEADMEKARNLFVGGNYAFASLAIVADVVAGVSFLTPYLNSIRYIKEGAKFGGQNAMDRFDGISGGRADYDPTQGMTTDTAIDL